MNKQKAIEKAKKLGPEYKYVAMDFDGYWHAFKRKPSLNGGCWYDSPDSHKMLFKDNIENGTLTKIYDDE